MSESCDEVCDVHTKTIRKARKPHKCCACRRTINAGERYVLVFTAFDGNACVYKRCGACEATHEHLVSLCRSSDEESLYPREDLGCGLKYESEWGALPDEIAALAFMPNAEASALLEARR